MNENAAPFTIRFMQHHFTEMEAARPKPASRDVAFSGDGGPAVRGGCSWLRDHWPQAPRSLPGAHEHLDRVLGRSTTVVLLLSSFTMVMAVLSARETAAKG